ncbi:MAG: DUF4280 domain-containing protein [Bacteroidales bacterium]|nr:DUF4280 domain-containing protein [Candidatus Physcousia equi]
MAIIDLESGEGFHYEKKELSLGNGETAKVNAKTPNERPKIMWDGADDAPAAHVAEQKVPETKKPEAKKPTTTAAKAETPKASTEAPEGYHYEQRELVWGDGEVATVNVKVPNEPPKLVVAGFEEEYEESKADADDYGQEGSNNDGVQTGSFVCATAALQCPFGTMQSKLMVGPDRTTSIGGKPMANIMDFTPMFNIMPFGQCTSMAFPATASATAAAMGTLTPMPCIPNVVAPWVPPKANLMVNGQPALMNTCTCQCIWGGLITIQMDGQ